MGRVPQFPLYTADFLVGTADMSHEQVGQYIRLLCWMHQKGPLDRQQIETLVGPMAPEVERKLTEECGKFFNTRLLEEIEKYNRYVESRLKNLKGKDHKGSHMGQKKTDHMDTPYGKPICDSDSDSDNTVQATTTLEQEFEAWWSKYPRKETKSRAKEWWMRNVKPKDIPIINKALDNYIPHAAGKEHRYIKLGKTFLNEWRDWVDVTLTAEEEAEQRAHQERIQRLEREFEEDQRRYREYIEQHPEHGKELPGTEQVHGTVQEVRGQGVTG